MEVLLIASVLIVGFAMAGDKIGSKALPLVIVMCLIWGIIIIVGAASDFLFVR